MLRMTIISNHKLKIIMNALEDNREYRRLSIKMPFKYQRKLEGRSAVQHGVTKNISTGGMYFETAKDTFQPGELLTIELDVSENEGYFPTNSSIQAVGEVVHITPVPDLSSSDNHGYYKNGVGIRFCDSLKLVF